MKITRIELKNWGPHEHLNVDMDASVVGIIGPNGHGKSNFLQAIDFGLNGNLNKQNKEAYIRNFGMEDGATKASVVIEFVKNGKKGKITRTITKSQTTRLLEWDGGKYKSDADVSNMMISILGADKNAMANAIFVKQGDLDKIVKGTPAVRQEVFLKLMNLAFVEAREHELLNRITKLKSGLVDLAPVLDNLRMQEDSLKSNLDILKQNVSSDRSEEIKKYEECLTVMTNVNSALNAVNDAKAELASSSEKLEATVAKDVVPNGYASLEALESSYNAGMSRLETLRLELVKAQEAVKWADVYEETVQNLHAMYGVLNEHSTKLKGMPPVQTLRAKERSILESKAQVALIDGLRSEISSLDKEISDVEEELSQAKEQRVQAETNKANKRSGYEKKILEYTETKGREAMKYKFFSADDASTTCPICDSPLPVISDKKQFLLKLESSIATLKGKIEELQAKMSDLDSDVTKAKIKEQMAVTQYRSADSRRKNLLERLVEALSATRVADTVEELDKMYAEVHGQLEAATEAQAIVDRAGGQISALTAKKASVLKSYTEEELDTASSRRDSVTEELQTLEAKIEDQKNLLTVVKQMEEAVGKAKASTTTARQFYNKQVAAMKALPADMQGKSAEEIGKVKDLLVEAQERYVTNNALKTQAEENLKDIESRIKDVQEKIDADGERRKLIEDLGILREVISKNGLPLQYMSFVFERLTIMVVDILNDMCSNFSVSIDPDQPLSYKFTRNDNGDGYEMPQEMLSGGQAIRLALALLIACQQIILPEVGLLVLDEPSSHIDADGVCSLKDMFCDMASVFQSSESQLIVVDHNSILETAFEKTLKL